MRMEVLSSSPSKDFDICYQRKKNPTDTDATQPGGLMSWKPPTTRTTLVVNVDLSGKRRVGNEPEPSFMKEKQEGFTKDGKHYITSTKLQVLYMFLYLHVSLFKQLDFKELYSSKCYIFSG